MAKKATILIVDRERILVDLLTRALSSPDLSVLGTTSADEAARLIDLHGPDLVVIDPSIQNGIPLIASVSSDQHRTHVVVVTDSEEIRERALTLGLQTIVDRNSGLDALVGAIRTTLPSNVAVLEKGDRIGVLIVDDEDEIRNVLSEFLKGHGYAVSTARNGQEALERLGADRGLQIVLLDVSMPVKGGMEVLSEIMSREPHPSVIMMTAIADREIARQALRIGAFDYILKPFNFAAIEAGITACLSHSEYQKQPWWKRLTRR